MRLAVGVDVGGTNIVAGLVDEAGRVLRKLKRPTLAREGAAAVLARVADMARELAGAGGSGVVAVGAGIPGHVDPAAGVSKSASNLGWRDVPVAERLGSLTGLPAFIDNDVRMYVYGEAAAGAGRGCDPVLGVTIGTGIAAAMVSRGELHYGFRALSGEIGHVRMDGEDEACACGQRGCLEAVASASGMVRAAQKALQAGRPSLLRDWFPGEAIARLTAADLSRAMDAGDSLASDVVSRAGILNGRALAAAVMVLGPEAVIVGGGGALAGERLMAPLRRELLRLVQPDFRAGLKVLTAQNNDEAGVIGSALYAMRRI